MTRTRVIVAAALTGLAILTVVLAYVSLNELGSATIVGYQRTGDDRKIVIVIQTGLGVDVADREVKEDGSSVRVTVRVRPHGSGLDLGVRLPVLVTLQDRLGDRRVLDQNGGTVIDLGVYRRPGAP